MSGVDPVSTEGRLGPPREHVKGGPGLSFVLLFRFLGLIGCGPSLDRLHSSTVTGMTRRGGRAPMEVLGDQQFREAMATVGGMDEMVREFIRVPDRGHAASLAKRYKPDEVAPIPIAPQVMGSEDRMMREITRTLVQRGAHRVDLNCGCPSKKVTKKGAGSSLLREPRLVHEVVHSMTAVAGELSDGLHPLRVTVKMRSGFDDPSVFLDNVRAAEGGGAAAITIHPRTARQSYRGRADWSLIRDAKRCGSVPIVGNGDITSVEAAVEVLETTGCDALMIGRGAVMNPWLFHEIRARLDPGYEPPLPRRLDDVITFWRTYMQAGWKIGNDRAGNVGRMKMIARYYLDHCEWFRRRREEVLRTQTKDPELFLELLISLMERHHRQCEECRRQTSSETSCSGATTPLTYSY